VCELVYIKKRQESNKDKEYETSPESLVIPYEDINTRQNKISGEKLPDTVVELCETCHWSCTYFNAKGKIMKCPVCYGSYISQISLNIDEVCSLQYDDMRGITLSFSRMDPIR
jgi:hypothetical protein